MAQQGTDFSSAFTDAQGAQQLPHLDTGSASVLTQHSAGASTEDSVPSASATASGTAGSGNAVPPPVPSAPPKEPAIPKEPVIIRRKVNGFVGFSNLPQQWHAKSIRKGFNLNVMVAGESGLGKSTMLNTLFEVPLHDLDKPVEYNNVDDHTVTIKPVTANLEENGVKLRLTVIDTPGFGDYVNNLDAWKPLVEEIDARFNQHLEGENAINRSAAVVDNRIHACLYFIEPTGHALKPLDIVVMKKLHKKVNLIPVIAKADTMTDGEVTRFKNAVLEDIKFQGIDIFSPPTYDDDDEETAAETAELLSRMPFAIVGSTQHVQTSDGRTVLGRQYPWGVVEVMNEDHSDFVKLRSLLIRNHLEDLRERTANALYENYRTDKMLEMGIQQDPSVFQEVDPALRQEEERKLHEQRLEKMGNEMRAVFQQKVTEKEAKLKKSEAELFQKHKEIKEQLDQQRQELEARKSRLEQQHHADAEKKSRKGGFSLR